MILHNNKELFSQLIIMTSDAMGIDASIVEKDYYVTAFLKSLIKKQPGIIFKGGTSLSKCYKLIKRFSEDIDLNLECEKRPTEGQRKRLKDNIILTIDEFDFELNNPEEVRSRRDYNKYIVDFPSVFPTSILKQYLVIETSVFFRAYPHNRRAVSNYIADFLQHEKRDNIISEFQLEPFEISAQSLERTFIDKLFAIGDYYLDNRIIEHSRHIYDLYKLLNVVDINSSMKELFEAVKRERMNHPACLSAQAGVNLKALLQDIIDENAYKNDYKTITENLLFEKVPYEIAIISLKKIVDSTLLL